MQTFLPYPSFEKSAAVLDRLRLGKQRVECLQLVKTLASGKGGWINHPACVMWRGHERALVDYAYFVCWEWTGRGYTDTCAEKISKIAADFSGTREPPPWLGDESFHASHRSNLLRKDPDWYGRFGWTEKDDLPYVWPGASAG